MMISSLIDIFCTQAREHKLITSFFYNRSYEQGSGREAHPLLWLEDPIYGRNEGNVFVNSVNFSILFVPSDEDSVADLQNLAFSVGLNIIERIKDQDNGLSVRPDWSFVTLRDYYDNGACGCRFTVNLIQPNMQNLCLIDEQFDADARFETESLLPQFAAAKADGQTVFVNKLPEFNLKTTR